MLSKLILVAIQISVYPRFHVLCLKDDEHIFCRIEKTHPVGNRQVGRFSLGRPGSLLTGHTTRCFNQANERMLQTGDCCKPLSSDFTKFCFPRSGWSILLGQKVPGKLGHLPLVEVFSTFL